MILSCSLLFSPLIPLPLHRPSLRRSLAALRQGLHHFASTLHRYLHVGVVAAEFHKLQQQVKGGTMTWCESLNDRQQR